jgi:hypothetical protein
MPGGVVSSSFMGGRAAEDVEGVDCVDGVDIEVDNEVGVEGVDCVDGVDIEVDNEVGDEARCGSFRLADGPEEATGGVNGVDDDVGAVVGVACGIVSLAAHAVDELTDVVDEVLGAEVVACGVGALAAHAVGELIDVVDKVHGVEVVACGVVALAAHGVDELKDGVVEVFGVVVGELVFGVGVRAVEGVEGHAAASLALNQSACSSICSRKDAIKASYFIPQNCSISASV